MPAPNGNWETIQPSIVIWLVRSFFLKKQLINLEHVRADLSRPKPPMALTAFGGQP
jgi:hypothetical protein